MDKLLSCQLGQSTLQAIMEDLIEILGFNERAALNVDVAGLPDQHVVICWLYTFYPYWQAEVLLANPAKITVKSHPFQF
jgi:hypothetical protein